jgi:hypothetical protein
VGKLPPAAPICSSLIALSSSRHGSQRKIFTRKKTFQISLKKSSCNIGRQRSQWIVLLCGAYVCTYLVLNYHNYVVLPKTDLLFGSFSSLLTRVPGFDSLQKFQCCAMLFQLLSLSSTKNRSIFSYT